MSDSNIVVAQLTWIGWLTQRHHERVPYRRPGGNGYLHSIPWDEVFMMGGDPPTDPREQALHDRLYRSSTGPVLERGNFDTRRVMIQQERGRRLTLEEEHALLDDVIRRSAIKYSRRERFKGWCRDVRWCVRGWWLRTRQGP